MAETTGRPKDAPKTPDATLTPKSGDDIDVGPLFEYLKSAQGHEILSRVVSFIEGIKKATLDKNADLSVKQLDDARLHRRNTQLLQFGATFTVITASVILLCVGKFDSTVGVLFGTIMGYMFGKRAASDL